MPKFIVIRRKTYHTEVEAAIIGDALDIAKDLRGSAWELKEDRVVGMCGVDGALQRFTTDADGSHDPSCVACVVEQRPAQASATESA